MLSERIQRRIDALLDEADPRVSRGERTSVGGAHYPGGAVALSPVIAGSTTRVEARQAMEGER